MSAAERAEPSPAILLAIAAVERHSEDANYKSPEKDGQLLILRQWRHLARETLDRAELAEHQASMVRMSAAANLRELAKRIRLREVELGIERTICSACREPAILLEDGSSKCCNAATEDQ